MIIKTINKMASSQASATRGSSSLLFSLCSWLLALVSAAPFGLAPLDMIFRAFFADDTAAATTTTTLFYRGNYARSYTCLCSARSFIIGKDNSTLLRWSKFKSKRDGGLLLPLPRYHHRIIIIFRKSCVYLLVKF